MSEPSTNPETRIALEFKRLRRENLRDHMTDLELIFSMLGEAATTEITRTRDAQGFPQSKQAAQAGGGVAGNARRGLTDVCLTTDSNGFRCVRRR